jgi:hypothetical protein
MIDTQIQYKVKTFIIKTFLILFLWVANFKRVFVLSIKAYVAGLQMQYAVGLSINRFR